MKSVRLLGELPKTAEVVVIGGGIVGTASAFFLSRAGFNVVLIEQADALAQRTTAVSAHAIRCQFSEAENIAQMSESLHIYETFRDLLGDPAAQIDLTQNGYLFASPFLAIENRNTSPPSGRFATSIRPPWKSMALRTIARPSPVPPARRERPLSIR